MQYVDCLQQNDAALISAGMVELVCIFCYKNQQFGAKVCKQALQKNER